MFDSIRYRCSATCSLTLPDARAAALGWPGTGRGCHNPLCAPAEASRRVRAGAATRNVGASAELDREVKSQKAAPVNQSRPPVKVHARVF